MSYHGLPNWRCQRLCLIAVTIGKFSFYSPLDLISNDEAFLAFKAVLNSEALTV